MYIHIKYVIYIYIYREREIERERDHLPQGNRLFLTACRKEAIANFPLPLTGPYHSGWSDPLCMSLTALPWAEKYK